MKTKFQTTSTTATVVDCSNSNKEEEVRSILHQKALLLASV